MRRPPRVFRGGHAACCSGEASGYRAVVEMLSDPDDGAFAAERYRGCRAGLGAHGGRFHRRRAECVGHVFGYVWRFEFSERAARGADRGVAIRRAASLSPKD